MLKKDASFLINSLDFDHWIVQRFTALSLVVLLIISYIYDSLFLFVLSFVFLSSHAFVGLSVLIDDYMHDNFLSLYVIVSIRLFIIYFLKSIFVLFI